MNPLNIDFTPTYYYVYTVMLFHCLQSVFWSVSGHETHALAWSLAVSGIDVLHLSLAGPEMKCEVMASAGLQILNNFRYVIFKGIFEI